LLASDGNIYVYATQGNGYRFQVAMSTDGCTFTLKGEAMPTAPSWANGDWWAPDVTEHNGTFYMLFSAAKNDGSGDHCTGSALSSSALGPFKDTGTPLVCGPQTINIDSKMFDDPKQSNGTCAYDGVIHDLVGDDVAQVTYTGNTDADKDSSCCTQCKQNTACQFWVRSTDNSSCWLKKNFNGYLAASNRRGNFKYLGATYLYWRGDFSPLGVQELDTSRTKLASGSVVINTVSPDSSQDYQSLVEGSWPQYNAAQDYYYLYFSGNNCCGTSRHYSVMIARSRQPKGPFQLYANYYGLKTSAILVANSVWDAPGHNSVLVDKNKQEWMFYHAMHQGNLSARVLLMDKITYNNDGWPQVPGAPSSSTLPGPVI